MESYVNSLKNNEEQNNNTIKTEPNSILNPNVNHMYLYNTNRNTDTNENESDNENEGEENDNENDSEENDFSMMETDGDSPKLLRQPIKRKLVDKSIVFPKHARQTRKQINNFKDSPIVPGLISDRKKAIQNSEYGQKLESNLKKQEDLIIKQENETKKL